MEVRMRFTYFLVMSYLVISEGINCAPPPQMKLAVTSTMPNFWRWFFSGDLVAVLIHLPPNS